MKKKLMKKCGGYSYHSATINQRDIMKKQMLLGALVASAVFGVESKEPKKDNWSETIGNGLIRVAMKRKYYCEKLDENKQRWFGTKNNLAELEWEQGKWEDISWFEVPVKDGYESFRIESYNEYDRYEDDLKLKKQTFDAQQRSLLEGERDYQPSMNLYNPYTLQNEIAEKLKDTGEGWVKFGDNSKCRWDNSRKINCVIVLSEEQSKQAFEEYKKSISKK